MYALGTSTRGCASPRRRIDSRCSRKASRHGRSYHRPTTRVGWLTAGWAVVVDCISMSGVTVVVDIGRYTPLLRAQRAEAQVLQVG